MAVLKNSRSRKEQKMKRVSDRELVKVLMAKNAALAAQAGTNASNVDYLAMMSGVEIPVTEKTEVKADE
jgi:hypothetical protein